jgi:hypothetical protein
VYCCKEGKQSQMFNRNYLKIMMVEVYEGEKKDNLETVVQFFFKGE